MSDYKVWFGNIRYATWIPAPKSGMGATAVGRVDSDTTANGGGIGAASAATHATYNMDWPASNKDDLMPLYNLRDGMYGNGLLQLVDPFNNNAFPPHWAEPALTADEWPSLISAGIKPAAVYEGTVRTNLFTDPRGTNGASFTTTLGTNAGSTTGMTWTRTSTGAANIFATAVTVAASTNYVVRMTVVSSLTGAFPYYYRPTASSTTGQVVIGTVNLVAGVPQTLVNVVNTGATAPTGTRGFGFTTPTGVVGNTFKISNVIVEQGTTIGQYFDGTTQYVDGRTSAWSGTADASTSVSLTPIPGMPSRSAVYSLSGPLATQFPARSSVLLVPTNQTLWVGFSGVGTNGGGVYYKPVYIDGSIGPATPLTMLAPSGTTRLNTSFDGSVYSAVIFYIDTTTTGSSSVQLNSAKAVYAVTGVTPTLTGVHVRGEGHTGMRFAEAITEVYIGVQGTMDTKLISAATSLTEVGAWL